VVTGRQTPEGPTDVQLAYGDVVVGEGTIPRRTPLSYGITPFTVGYQGGGSICPALAGRAELTPGVLRRVVVEALGAAAPRPDLQLRRDLATQ
jgi:hypothetical protein